MTDDRKWDSRERDVNGMKEVSQLMERCGKVSQLSGSVAGGLSVGREM